jgi:hypothetical protein
MPTSYNIAGAARAIFNEGRTRTYVAFFGTSQSTATRGYAFDYGFQRVIPHALAPIVGWVGQSNPSGSNVSAYGIINNTGNFVRTGLGGLDTDTQYDSNSVACLIKPVQRQTYLANLADSTFMGNLILNSRNLTSGVAGNFDWQPVLGTDAPWFHQRIRTKCVYLNTPGAINFQYTTQVVTSPAGTPATTGSYGVATPTATGNASNPFAATAFTPAVNYPGYANTEVRFRVESNSSDESVAGSHFTCISPVFEVVTAGDVRPGGIVVDVCGRAGTSTAERLSQCTQAALQSYYAAVMDPDMKNAVIFIDGEHNADASHRTGSAFNTTFRDAVRDEALRHRNAMIAARPDVTVYIVRIVAWPYFASANGMDSLEAVQTCEAQTIAGMQQVPNGGVVSIASLLANIPPATNNLHLTDGSGSTLAQPQTIASLMVSELLKASNTGTAFLRGRR